MNRNCLTQRRYGAKSAKNYLNQQFLKAAPCAFAPLYLCVEQLPLIRDAE
jgi:hypothetical protein